MILYTFYSLSIGMWVRGKRQGSGEIIYPNNRFVGNFFDDLSVGPGKYQFDIGCEQLGEFKLTRFEYPKETEEEDILPVFTPIWKVSCNQTIQ